MIETEKKEKRIRYVTGLIALFMCMLVITTPVADAKGDIREAPYAMAKQITQGATKSVKMYLTSSTDDGANRIGDPGKLYSFATGEKVDNGGTNIQFATVFKTFTVVLKTLGIAVAIIFAFIKFFQSLEKGQDVIEGILKLLIEIFIVMLVIINVETILGWISDIGNLITEALDQTIDDKNRDIARAVLDGMGIKAKNKNGTFLVGGLNLFKGIAMLIVPWALSFFVTIGGYFVAFSILFELMIRRLFTPFAVADIYGEGLRSRGMRWLLKYLAVYIKIAICLAVCYIAGVAQALIVPDDVSGILTDIFSVIGFLLLVIALNFTAIGVMLRGGEMANEVVGA